MGAKNGGRTRPPAGRVGGTSPTTSTVAMGAPSLSGLDWKRGARTNSATKAASRLDHDDQRGSSSQVCTAIVLCIRRQVVANAGAPVAHDRTAASRTKSHAALELASDQRPARNQRRRVA